MAETSDRERVETNLRHTVRALNGLANLLASSDGGCSNEEVSDLLDIIARDAALTHDAAMRLPDRPQS